MRKCPDRPALRFDTVRPILETYRIRQTVKTTPLPDVADSDAKSRSALMTTIEKVLYTGKTHTTGGRDGAARSSDAQLDVKLSPPGSAHAGTNPEQLFAAGWSACFIG